MAEGQRKIVGLSCSIFRRELEALRERGSISFPIHYLNSMLHMRPNELHETLSGKIDYLAASNDAIILLYGECHNRMELHEGLANVFRLKGRNCIEIFLGKESYIELSKSRAFFFLPEWTHRWREIFQKELGLTEKIAPEFMKEMHSTLLYLDTGIIPVPKETLGEASRALGLPYDVLPISLEPLLENIRDTLKSIEA